MPLDALKARSNPGKTGHTAVGALKVSIIVPLRIYENDITLDTFSDSLHSVLEKMHDVHKLKVICI